MVKAGPYRILVEAAIVFRFRRKRDLFEVVKTRNSLFYAAPSYIKYNPVISRGKECKAKLMPFKLTESPQKGKNLNIDKTVDLAYSIRK